MKDLAWLGLNWDGEPILQSSQRAHYQLAIEQVLNKGCAYPCVCTRREVETAASAPHAEDGAAVYPGTCRGKYASVAEARAACGREPAIRFAMPDETIAFEDGFAGRREYACAALGDFVIAKADGTPAYQLAVVVDDLAGGISEVVRGDDLLDSTPRQMLLYRTLNAADRIPRYMHLPLVIGTDGRRLAKRHGDTRLSHYREAGVASSRVLAMLARWIGITDISAAEETKLRASDLIGRFNLDRLSHEPIVFSAADDAWLRAELH